MDAAAPHISVLMREVLELLAVEPGMTVVDATAGAGGHLRRLAEAVGPTGRVIGIDRDLRAFEPSAAGGVAAEYSDRVSLKHAAFSEVARLLEEEQLQHVDALLCDLGVSSMQLDEADRGFSFRHDGPLDMRMDKSRGETAWELLASRDEREIADILFHYGEERRSRRIAHAIKRAWPLADSTLALADVIAHAMGGPRGRIHPATRSFQALRIAVNRELDELDALLVALPSLLRTGGRAAVISFHSLEDRKVKHAFRDGTRAADDRPALYRVLNKRPLMATDDERDQNPRSRSAKLRAVERV